MAAASLSSSGVDDRFVAQLAAFVERYVHDGWQLA
jgi:hypothetical protein